jgi:hypothetical protein
MAKRRRSLAAAEPAGERHFGFRALGVAVSTLAAPVVAKRGGGVLVRLKAEWAAIVGPDWAALAWPMGYGRDGVLKLRTVPSAALELMHRAPLLIERVNLYFGRPAVTRLVLVQATLPLSPGHAAPAPLPAPDPTDGCNRSLSGIADPELRAALARLAAAISAAGN